MGEMPPATYPMQIVSADLIGPLPESPSGSRYALTIVDHCTGWAEALPLKDKTNRSVWTAFTNGFIARHGIPEVLITDNGGEFTAYEFEKYLQQIGIEHHCTTPVHPQSNGRTERFNRTLKEMLRRMINNCAEDWEDRLGEALLAYRTSVSTTTGYTPFYLLYGRRSRMPLAKTLQITSEEGFCNSMT
jgi:transposase InsO family protein